MQELADYCEARERLQLSVEQDQLAPCLLEMDVGFQVTPVDSMAVWVTPQVARGSRTPNRHARSLLSSVSAAGLDFGSRHELGRVAALNRLQVRSIEQADLAQTRRSGLRRQERKSVPNTICVGFTSLVSDASGWMVMALAVS